ncbi:biotin carboxylase N-terminal domain-containing protein [Nocardia sp. 2YAB30]
MIKRIAIVKRGEAAVRLTRAVRELNAEHNHGIRTIALHTDAERRAMFVRQADESVTLRRNGVVNPYLDHAELERALLAAEADAPPAAAVRWWYWRISPASTAHQNRCAASNSSTAPKSAAP